MERGRLRQIVMSTGCAMQVGGQIFMEDPARAGQLAQMLRGDAAGTRSEQGEGWLCLPTGGTSGLPRFARHDEATVGSAVRGFQRHFGVAHVNVVDLLPAHHVSGLMARIRSMDTGGERLEWSWKRLETGDCPELPGRSDGWFTSLVPTQLHRMLAQRRQVDWLRRFRAVLLGGGPLWPGLVEKARAADLPVVISYGMTETAAMVSAQLPGDFSAGDFTAGRALPHAVIEIIDEATGEGAPAGIRGMVRVSGESVFRGYWPDRRADRALVTEDIGSLDVNGRLMIHGRRDAMIITGGKKVSPVEVENVLRAAGLFTDIAVVGIPDGEWGSIVVACHPDCGILQGREELAAALERLPAHMRPKRWVAVAPWPRNDQGKLNRAALIAAATQSA